MLVIFLSLVVSTNGFLLDVFQNKSGHAISSGQFLTVAEFYGEKNIQHQDMEHLRQDMDKKLALLANQLQQQLATLSIETIRNETKRDMMLLVQKYTTLERDHNKLQTSHNQLQKAHTMLQGQLNIQSMFNNHTDTKIRKGEKEIEILSNKSIAMDNELSALKHLANIKPLQDISALQQNVQVLKTQTLTLNMKEQARSQDFLALFNMTMESKKDINVQFHNQTVALSALENRMNERLMDSEKHENLTFSFIQDQINNNAEKVAMTAFFPTGITQYDRYLSVGRVVRFRDVKFSVGIKTLSSFKNTGKFDCEKSGLYMVSVSMEVNMSGTEFHIYVNGTLFTKNFKYDTSSGHWHSISVSIVIELNTNDTVWVQIGGFATDVRGDLHSRFTIIKIH